MKKIFLIILTIGLISACSRKTSPSAVNKQKTGFDTAVYDYIYVEALKQKFLGNAGDALRYFEQCVTINPNADAAWYQMAQVLAGKDDLIRAGKYAAKAASLDEKNLYYLMMVAGLYYQGNKIDSAIIWYEKAARYFPENKNIQLSLGDLYIRQGSFVKANSIFDSLDQKYGPNDESTILSVRSLMALKNYPAAENKIMTLLKDKPDDINYNGILAAVLHEEGKNNEAMAVYKQLQERDPRNPQIQLALADFLFSTKDYNGLFSMLSTITLNNDIKKEDKIAFFAKLMENADLIPDQGNRLAVSLMVLEANYKEDMIIPLLRPDLLIKQGKLADAAMRLEELIKANAQNYYAWEKLLLVYMEEKNYSMLAKRGEECSTMFNMSFLAKVLYANGALETGKYDVALSELKKAEILAGDNKEYLIQVLTMRADVYYRMKDYQNSFSVFEQALKINDQDITVLNNYAYYLAEQNMKLKEAEELSKKVISIEKNNITFLDTYGWVLYKRGKLNEAAKVFESILEKGERPDAELYEHYGYILKKQKKCDKAVESFQMALKIDPSKVHLTEEIKNCKR